MAKTKTAKNMLQNRDEYARFFQGFRGVDFSSDHTEVIDQRFAYLVNMWRDYKSGEGGAVETIPGFRFIRQFGSQIYGYYAYNGHRIVHSNKRLAVEDVLGYFECNYIDGLGVDINVPGIVKEFIYDVTVASKIDPDYAVSVAEWEIIEKKGLFYIEVEGVELDPEKQIITVRQGVLSEDMAEHPSTSVIFGNKIYFFDGSDIHWYDEGPRAYKLSEDGAYVPTTHHLIYPGSNDQYIAPGVEMDQRNILTPKYKNKFIAGTKTTVEGYKGNEFQLKYGSDFVGSSPNNESIEKEIYPEKFEVYQYGVKLPWAFADYSEWITRPEYKVINGFPNSIVSISKDGLVTLVKSPPAPDHNTWNPEKKIFDYTDVEIEEGLPKKNNYEWPWAYTEYYDGIEIIAENAITNINGIEAKSGYASIITHCTIATVFDNRLFLSGNPEFPTHIFWSALNGETSYPDPTYFGISNNDIEGVTSSPVVAMIPVADQLMVLKKESVSEGSVIFHTPTDGTNNVAPRIYPSTQGLAGRGCLGAAVNFLDDPVFISRFGLEAMGSYTNAKYERSIEHRSSLIDSKLLTCDLSRAQLIEYEGYLLLLVDGKIFMADSRQTFTHQTGVMQYEWYYLEDIGYYEGQFEECVYARFPKDLTGEAMPDDFGGRPLLEADGVRNELGVPEDLIGKIAFESAKDVTYTEVAFSDGVYGKLYYKEIKDRDEYGRELYTSSPYYVEPTGAMIGGTFVPAEKLYVIDGDLYFSAKARLYKFNFDKRDTESGIIPVEWYNFGGRRIFSGVATKMDNCGIPHLTKNTVKRSTVVKTRTFTHSNAKIKVRTNRKAFTQVGRIINGTEVFDGLDFADFTFNVDGKTLFSINEKEKKWVEKQHFIYSDGYCEPFALYYLAYRYNVAGRYKEE